MRPVTSDNPSGEVLPVPHYSYELPTVEEERFEKLFRQLDVNGDGRIDIIELSQSLHKHGVPENLKESYATKFIQQSDLNQSGDVSLAEFIYYVSEHEKKLLLLFSNLDTDKDGRIKVNELITAFRDLGVAISRQEAAQLLKRIDKDGSLDIGFNEWRDFLLFHPTADLSEIINYWRHSTLLNSFHARIQILSRMAEGLQKKMQQEVEKFKAVQKEYQSVISSRQQLDSQLTENSGVKEELNLLESDANVFKLIGPVLVKQDLEEARQNVNKRIDYITGETKRLDKTIEDLDKKQDVQREALGKLQQQLQQAQVKAAMKA
uniref:Probable prefoldin subunit 6 n=1 Tax=Daphnia longispina TaxID=42846 RepID=A0A4Y7M502_9CRUS|nr:EOG090X0MQF [Daphnia longispina]